MRYLLIIVIVFACVPYKRYTNCSAMTDIFKLDSTLKNSKCSRTNFKLYYSPALMVNNNYLPVVFKKNDVFAYYYSPSTKNELVVFKCYKNPKKNNPKLGNLILLFKSDTIYDYITGVRVY